MFGVNETNLHRWVIPIAVTTVLLGILFFLFPYNTGDTSLNTPLGPTLWQIWTDSSVDAQDHTYCLLVPIMLAYQFYEKKKEIAQAPVRGTNAALNGVFIGLLLFWIGSRAGKQYIGCAGIQVLLVGIIFWFWGGSVFQRLLFAWAILWFAWPLPFLDTAVAFPLRMIVSHTAYYVLNFIGIPCTQNGTALISPATATGLPMGARFQIDVADPCSGLHSLLPLLMFSAFYCYFFLPKLWQRWTVFFSSFIFTIAGNVVRILMLVIGSMLWGQPFAIGTNDEPSWFHEACGFAVFIVVLGLECLFGYSLIMLDRYRSKSALATSALQPETRNPSAEPGQSHPFEMPIWRSGVIGGFVALALAVYLFTPPVYLPSEAGVVMSLPEEVKLPWTDGGNFLASDTPVTDVELKMLPKDTAFARKNYDDYHDHKIFFSIVLSGLQQYTIHPPEICLVAQGWTIVGHEDVPIKLSSGHQLTVRNLSLEREALNDRNEHVTVKAYYMYWYVADDLTTPSQVTRNWISIWDRIFHNRDHRWAYVIAMSPITQTLRPDGLNADQTRDLLTGFIRQIVPTFQKNELQEHADNS